MYNSLTDTSLEIQLQTALKAGLPLSELSPILLDALNSSQKSTRLTAIRFLQLHPEWSLWKTEFEPWLREQKRWPWEVIIPWITQQRFNLSWQEKDSLLRALNQQKATHEIARNSEWSSLFEEFKSWRDQARLFVQRKYLEVRDLLFEELKTWRSQRLREQEQKVLLRLKKKFPNDRDILKELESFKENQASETLQDKLRERRTRQRSLKFVEEVTELPHELRQDLQEKLQQNPQMGYDLAMVCVFCEDWQWALQLITQSPPSQARDWLEIEILLKLKRYIDVIHGLTVIESRWYQDGETFFATAYARAQAYYGLGHKEKAFEILESLLASRPIYRQSAELLSQWKGLT